MEIKYMSWYQFFVHSEPVPKHTQKPPRVRSGSVYHTVMNSPGYKRLAETWKYQELVAECAMVAGIPKFDTEHPIEIKIEIRKAKRKRGDNKNILAAIEDGLVHGGFIPDDSQITTEIDRVSYNNGVERAGVMVTLRIDRQAESLEWLIGFFGNHKKAVDYHNRVVRSPVKIRGFTSYAEHHLE